MKKQESAPLLELLNQRWDEIISGLPDQTPDKPFKRPAFNEREKEANTTAAREHAQAHNSDPFAFTRMRHYIRQGYALASDVQHDARALLGSRRAQGIVIPVAATT